MYRSTHKKEKPQYSFIQENRDQEAARQYQKNVQQNLKPYQVEFRANNFFDSIKQETLPTPKKKGSEFQSESTLINYLTDKESYARLERYLHDRHYDGDRLHFYVKVLELKQEQDSRKALYLAGLIMDGYLCDQAQNFV
jgi:hypothetical protein